MSVSNKLYILFFDRFGLFIKETLLILSLSFLLLSCQEDAQDAKMPEIDKKYLSESQLFALNQAVERDPDEPENYYQRARVYLERRDLSKAFADIEKAISLDPQKGKYYLLKGRVLRGMKNYEEALSVLRQAEALRVDDAELKILLADLFLQKGNKTKASAYLQEATSLTPFHPEVLFLKGKLAAMEGDTVQAVISYFAVLHKDTGNVAAYKELSKIYYNNKKADSSMVFITAGRIYEPNDPFFPYQEGRILQNQNLESSALAGYNTALMLDSSYSNSYNALANYWYKKGDLGKARKYFEKELSYDSNSINSSLYLAEIYEKEEAGYSAIPLAERVLKLDSLNKKAKAMLDRLYKKYPKPKEEVVSQPDTIKKQPVPVSPSVTVKPDTVKKAKADTVKKVQPIKPVKSNSDTTVRKPSAKPKVKDTTKGNNLIPLITNPDSTKIETPIDKVKKSATDSLNQQ